MFLLEDKSEASYYEKTYIDSYMKEKWLPETLSLLNKELEDSEDFNIDNFDSKTLADICWTTIVNIYWILLSYLKCTRNEISDCIFVLFAKRRTIYVRIDVCILFKFMNSSYFSQNFRNVY